MDSGTGTSLDWSVSEWVNTGRPDYSTADLAGRVVVAAAFQMLCPGCVAETIPQLKRAAELFPAEHVAVVGLHTVFEHHAAMTPVALTAFLHEYRVTFPVAIDLPDPAGGAVPVTMARYAMQGTPTVMLYDRAGRLRRQSFGHLGDMQLGAEVVQLLGEQPAGCDDTGCRI